MWLRQICVSLPPLPPEHWAAGHHVRVSPQQTKCCLSEVGGWIKARCSLSLSVFRATSLSQWLDSISRPASITHTLMSLKPTCSPAFHRRCCLSHTGGWTHLFNPDLSFRHYEIVLFLFFFSLSFSFFFFTSVSDIGRCQQFSSFFLPIFHHFEWCIIIYVFLFQSVVILCTKPGCPTSGYTGLYFDLKSTLKAPICWQPDIQNKKNSLVFVKLW